MSIRVVDDVRFGIGEGAMWDEATRRFFAVDVLACELVSYDPVSRDLARYNVGQIIGSVALREGGGAIVGLAGGVNLYDFERGETHLVADVEPDNRSLLLTEGKADPAGRFLVSSFSTAMQHPVGSLFSIDSAGSATMLRDKIIVPNGLAWSPDGRTLYLADSGLQRVFAYDYDLSSGAIANERPFIDTTELGGIPDGATTDREGNYWVAICQAGLVACYAPDGVLRHKVEFPSKWVTSVAFGGSGLDELYVTSLDPKMMNMGEDPHGGKLFVLEGTGARGAGAFRYRD